VNSAAAYPFNDTSWTSKELYILLLPHRIV
jgi:hypothetical protein